MPPKKPHSKPGPGQEEWGGEKQEKPMKEAGKKEDFDEEFDKFVIKYEKEINQMEKKFA